MQQVIDNRYNIIKVLGSGGMAEVYLAHDDVLDRDVALKILSRRYTDDEEFIERFKREAQSAAALSHPNIVSIYDRRAVDGDTYYIAMEYLPGGTLKDRILQRGALPPAVATEVTLQIANALEVAHRRDLVHRDVKPHNILITESGDVKVADFGIARAASSTTMTRTGSILGTAHYISPEQAMGEQIGPQSDLYSLGVVLYEMLTGELPFDAETPIGIAMKHVNGQLRPPKAINPEVPDGLNAICVRLLSKDLDERYGSAEDLTADLERVRDGAQPLGETTQVLNRADAPVGLGAVAEQQTVRTSPVRSERAEARETGRRDRGERRRGRSLFPLVMGLVALAALALIGMIGWSLYQSWQEMQSQQAPVEVPELAGLTLQEARDQFGGDFTVQNDGEENSQEPEDTILSQNPEAGEMMQRGDTILVTVSNGQVDVPDVVGDQEAEAREALEGADFRVRVEAEESNDTNEGEVTAQDPEGGETAAYQSVVTVTVSAGPETVTVPSLTGLDPATAASELSSAGLQQGSVTEQNSDSVAEGLIISQSPSSGSEAQPDSSVGFVVSAGPQEPETVTVPDVSGQSQSAAVSNLQAAGLSVDSQGVLQNSSNVPEDFVIGTNPTAGTEVAPETTITLSISAGPEQTPPPSDAPSGSPGGSSPTPGGDNGNGDNGSGSGGNGDGGNDSEGSNGSGDGSGSGSDDNGNGGSDSDSFFSNGPGSAFDNSGFFSNDPGGGGSTGNGNSDDDD